MGSENKVKNMAVNDSPQNISEYALSLPIKDRQQYLNKLVLADGDSLPDPASIKDWVEDSMARYPVASYSLLPIDKPSPYTRESLCAYKSLDAYNYVVSGHVQTIFYKDIGKGFCALKAEVLPSQRQGKKTWLYKAWVVYNKEKCYIHTANCTCMAGTASSSINALTAVTVEDLIKPYIHLSEKHLSWTSKGLSLLYGALCIAMAAIASVMGGVLQAAFSIFGIIGGPLLGLFTLGILFPFANSKGAVLGLLSGLVVSLWVGIGAQLYPPPAGMSRPLDLSTAGCNFSSSLGGFNWSSTALPPQHSHPVTTGSPVSLSLNVRPLLADSWYSVSYLYFSPIGCITALTVGVVVSLLSGGLKLNVDSRFMLLKEDTTCYHIFRFLEEKVAGRRRNFDLTKNKAKKFGNSNLAFSDTELDLTKGHVMT